MLRFLYQILGLMVFLGLGRTGVARDPSSSWTRVEEAGYRADGKEFSPGTWKAEHGRTLGRTLEQAEVLYGLPPFLLHAIALTESGREGKWRQTMPWPWSLNVNKKTHYFGSKAAALRAARGFLAKGQSSLDVGVMQINLRHHPAAFFSLEQAFDPEANIFYAARFLKRLYTRLGSWEKAVACYHSSHPAAHIPYGRKVAQNWQALKKTAGSRGPSPLQRPHVVPVAVSLGGIFPPQNPLPRLPLGAGTSRTFWISPACRDPVRRVLPRNRVLGRQGTLPSAALLAQVTLSTVEAVTPQKRPASRLPALLAQEVRRVMPLKRS